MAVLFGGKKNKIGKTRRAVPAACDQQYFAQSRIMNH